jgi:hypothetical protein
MTPAGVTAAQLYFTCFTSEKSDGGTIVLDGWPVWQPSLLALGLTVLIGCGGHAVGVTCLGFGTSGPQTPSGSLRSSMIATSHTPQNPDSGDFTGPGDTLRSSLLPPVSETGQWVAPAGNTLQ